MKIHFNKLTTKKDAITVFDGDKNIVITKENFQKYLLPENDIPISGFASNLENLTITGDSVHRITFNQEQNQKQIELNKNYITLSNMSLSELQSYPFDYSKEYKIHINQNCMKMAGEVDNPLCNLIQSNFHIIEVVVDEDVKTIKGWAFYLCGDLQSIVISEGATSIDVCAFQYCRKLKSVTISNSVTSIGENAFYGCLSLTDVIIPDSVTLMSDFIFQDCNSLKFIIYTGTKEWWSLIYEVADACIPPSCVIYCTNSIIIIIQ